MKRLKLTFLVDYENQTETIGNAETERLIEEGDIATLDALSDLMHDLEHDIYPRALEGSRASYERKRAGGEE